MKNAEGTIYVIYIYHPLEPYRYVLEPEDTKCLHNDTSSSGISAVVI